jgi:hypothetical protein
MRNEGEQSKAFGQDIVLLHEDDDLCVNTFWGSEGFHVSKFIPEDSYTDFITGTYELFKGFIRKAGITIPDDIDLKKYHQWIDNRYDLHLKVVNQAKLLKTKQFPIPLKIVEKRISELCNTEVKACNPYNGDQVFHFRIIRPQSNDNNPLHRDVWLEEYQDCINIYVPICGSNILSSLSLVPGSHYWSENIIERTVKGANVNGIQFNVPAVTKSNFPLNIIRPNPGRNQLLIFSPYLIHGGAKNLNKDITRISLEMRFWRV